MGSLWSPVNRGKVRPHWGKMHEWNFLYSFVRKNAHMKLYLISLAVLCTSCTTMLNTTPTGEAGISMGDSYEKVLETLKPNNRITKTIEGGGIRAEGYSTITKDCRVKYFIFQGKDGLQQVKYEPAPNLPVNNKCQ